MKSLRRFLVLLLVLAYAGQGLAASAVPCQSMTMGSAELAGALYAMPDTMGAMDTNPHAGHHMGAEATTESAQGSCCDGGLCAMSQCQSAPAVPQTLSLAGQRYPAAYSVAHFTSSPIQPSYSLFRPPISR